MNCKKCGIKIPDEMEYCESCSAEESQSRTRNKSFWGELEKNQTTIEDFGYKVKTEIRKSDNTVVYIASNDADETVAIKKISLSYGSSSSTMSESDIAERIRAEMDVLSRISTESGDRFVITYYDYKLVEDADKLKYDLYIRMDYLTSIGQLYSESKLSVKDLLSMGIDICSALEWCHKNGRIHNNLNLNNIFINNDGSKYVLGDFASFVNKQNETEYCIAPELFYGDKPSASTDIYSLGMVMFVILNKGLHPFVETEDPDELALAMSRLKNGEVPSLTYTVNQRLNDLICKAISPKDKRFSSVDEMKNEISFLLTSMPEEWLAQNVNDIKEKRKEEPEPEEKKKKKTKEIEKERKKHEEEEKKTKELEPEEKELKKKNIKDFWLIGAVSLVLILAVVIGTVFLYNSGNRKIYSLIESESYAVAFKEISELQDSGQNVDELLKAYIDACMSDMEHKRVVQAIPLFSDEAYSDTDYFVNLFSDIMRSGKDRQTESVYNFLIQKGTLKEALDEMLKEQ